MLRRLAEALHELSKEEFAELAEIQYRLAQIMRQDSHTEKEYTMCFAEGTDFKHIHVHFVAKPADLLSEMKGPRIFAMLNVDEEHAIPGTEIAAFSEEFREQLQAIK